MTQTAHHIDQTFYVKYDYSFEPKVVEQTLPLQIDPSGDSLQTESGAIIYLDGASISRNTVLLSSYKLKRGTFVATGGNT